MLTPPAIVQQAPSHAKATATANCENGYAATHHGKATATCRHDAAMGSPAPAAPAPTSTPGGAPPKHIVIPKHYDVEHLHQGEHPPKAPTPSPVPRPSPR